MPKRYVPPSGFEEVVIVVILVLYPTLQNRLIDP
jgi:hypothetical protein